MHAAVTSNATAVLARKLHSCFVAFMHVIKSLEAPARNGETDKLIADFSAELEGAQAEHVASLIVAAMRIVRERMDVLKVRGWLLRHLAEQAGPRAALHCCRCQALQSSAPLGVRVKLSETTIAKDPAHLAM